MGLFDSIAAQAAGALLSPHGGPSAGPAGMMDAVTGLLGSHAAGGVGGLQGLVAMFVAKGLGPIIQSWIGSGQNLPISADQIMAVLGSSQVQAIAGKLGLSGGDAAGALAQFLPQAVDTMTPGGHLPDGHLMEQGLSLLKGLTGKG